MQICGLHCSAVEYFAARQSRNLHTAGRPVASRLLGFGQHGYLPIPLAQLGRRHHRDVGDHGQYQWHTVHQRQPDQCQRQRRQPDHQCQQLRCHQHRLQQHRGSEPELQWRPERRRPFHRDAQGRKRCHVHVPAQHPDHGQHLRRELHLSGFRHDRHGKRVQRRLHGANRCQLQHHERHFGLWRHLHRQRQHHHRVRCQHHRLRQRRQFRQPHHRQCIRPGKRNPELRHDSDRQCHGRHAQLQQRHQRHRHGDGHKFCRPGLRQHDYRGG